MAIESIGTSGLTALEKAQMVSSLAKTQKASLVSGLASDTSPISSDLMYNIYDQKAITPRILAATAAKTAADESDTTDDSETSTDSTSTTSSTTSSNETTTTPRDYSAIQDELIAQNRSYNTSEVPTNRPASVTGLSNVDLTA